MVSQPGRDELGKAKIRDYPGLVATSGDLNTVVDLAGRYLYCSAASKGYVRLEARRAGRHGRGRFRAPRRRADAPRGPLGDELC